MVSGAQRSETAELLADPQLPSKHGPCARFPIPRAPPRFNAAAWSVLIRHRKDAQPKRLVDWYSSSALGNFFHTGARAI